MTALTSTTLHCDAPECDGAVTLHGVGDQHLARLVASTLNRPWAFVVTPVQHNGVILTRDVMDHCPVHS